VEEKLQELLLNILVLWIVSLRLIPKKDSKDFSKEICQIFGEVLVLLWSWFYTISLRRNYSNEFDSQKKIK
jgi:hypothetical protein